MRAALLTLFLFCAITQAEEPPQVSIDLIHPYVLAQRLAKSEKKNLCVWVREDRPEGIVDGVDKDTICVSLKSFDHCEDGDAVYAEYREGGWHQWMKTIRGNGSVKFEEKPQESNRTSLLTNSLQNCPTGT